MKMKLRQLNLLVLSILTLTLTGCFYDKSASVPAFAEPELMPLDTGYTRNITNKDFDKVYISGNIDATLENQQSKNQLLFQGSANMRKSLHTHIKNRTLYIEYGNYPSNFTAQTPIRVDLKLASPIHAITLTGDGKTRMQGDWVLSRLDVSGNANCYAYWIDSTNMHILTTDNAKVFLAGVVSDLDIISRNHSAIDARNLKTENAYVRTQDKSQVNVSARNSLSSYSSEGSTVYLYGDAPLSIHYLNNHGSALRMAGIDR